jgi:exodeoxyribonuclease V beta subunit
MSVEPLAVEAAQPPTAPAFAANAWQPTRLSTSDGGDRDAYRSLRRKHAGAFVTSYTRMRAESDPGRPPNERAPSAMGAKPGVLRGARASGILLHHLLERVPQGSFAASAAPSSFEPFEVWRCRPDISSLVDDALAAYRVDTDSREYTERLVWGAFTTPLSLSRGDRLDGIAVAKNVVREMAFVFPVHGDDAHSSEQGRPALGYVRGSIDLAFEHAGLTYFVDWKSDSLASYSPDSLDRHVAEHYATQARLYAVAVVKLLGLETRDEYEARFGGMLYCFVRAFDATGQGLWSKRPSWDTLLAWQAALAQRAEVGS